MDARESIPHEIDLTVFVACYNEEVNIIASLRSLIEALNETPLTWEAVIIDDASRDRSVELIAGFIRENPELPLRLVVNEANRGLAQNYVEGAFRGRGLYYRLVCGDHAEDAETLKHVFAQVGKADMILFYHADNQRAWSRKVISSCYTRLVNFLTGRKLRYYNGCPILRRYDVMRWHTNCYGFGFQADLICRLLDEGFSYIEVPVKAVERAGGKSTALTMKNLLSVAHTFLDLMIRRTAHILYPKRRIRGRSIERTDLRPTKPEVKATEEPVLAGESR